MTNQQDVPEPESNKSKNVFRALRSGEELELTAHCIDRFHERVRPTLCAVTAAAEFRRQLAAFGQFTQNRPDWVVRDADAWIVIGPGIALPLVKKGCVYIAATTLCAGHKSPESVEHRRLAKRYRRSGRRWGNCR